MMRLDIAPTDLYGVHNLPYGIFSAGSNAPRVGVRYGDYVVDVAQLLGDDYFDAPTLNAFMQQGPDSWSADRRRIQRAVQEEVPDGGCHPIDDVQLHLPIDVGDYVDFYCSEHHATNIGRIFRPDSDALTPNWRHLPIGYHGRSQTIVVSGSEIYHPRGQRKGDDGSPTYGLEPRLDIESELAFVVGTSSERGQPVAADEFDDRVFGVAVFNDWSARAIQAWEYVPLGPHLGKSFASTLSAWITPMAALDHARVATPPQGPKLPYLQMNEPWGLDISLEIQFNGEVISRPQYRDLYWSPAQMLAQLTANGASIRTGDVFASGTVSGPERDQRGALIELTWGGAEPIIVGGVPRTFLEAGDTVVLRASAPGSGGSRIALGECAGTITS